VICRSLIASLSSRSLAVSWDPVTGKQRSVLTGHASSVTAVAIAPDGTWLATASDDNTQRIWDAAYRSEAIPVERSPRMSAVLIAGNGMWLATASIDRTVRIWDVAKGSISAFMRVDGALQDCAWGRSSNLLAAAGDAGVYVSRSTPRFWLDHLRARGLRAACAPTWNDASASSQNSWQRCPAR